MKKNRFQKLFASAVVFAVKVSERIAGRNAVRASFEAVRQNWGERSYLWQALQEYWQEIDSMTRQELQRVHQNLVENTPLVQKLRSLFLQFTVGPSGLSCTPNASRLDDNFNKTPTARKAEKTAVEQWNHLRGENWELWARRPFVGSPLSLAQGTIEWSGQLFDRGAFIVNLQMVEVPFGLRTRQEPRLETIDPIRLKTPTGQNEYQGRPIIDGVEIDPTTGARVAGWIIKSDYSAPPSTFSNRNTAEQFTRIEFYAPGMKGGLIHAFRPRFAGQIRELPEGFAAYNILRDINNLMQLEMHCAKLAGEIATVETNATGELNTRTNRQIGMKIPSVNAAGTAVQKNAFVDYSVSFGGKKIAMMQGDTLKNFMVDRPTVAQQDYWDTLFTNACMAYEQPKLLVMPYSLQGTVTRADLDVCANAYRFKFEIIKDVMMQIYEWHARWTEDQDTTFKAGETPKDYCAVVIRAPRAPNVDIGYTAKALEIELRLGAKTIADVWAEKQQDYRLKFREAAEAIALAKQLAEEFGIDAGQITDLALEQAVTDPKSDGEVNQEEDAGSARQKNSHLITA